MGKKIKFETVALPQNVKLMGEKEEKSIYISVKAYNKVHEFTKNKFDNESGGLLIGEYVEAFNAISIVIHDFIEAKYTEATKTTLTFTHKTWEYVHGEIDKNYENAKIVGWIHTHPGFGIFLSDYDKFIQNNFFSDENQVAYVVDPIQKLEGFFTIINGNLQRCKGFYIFDEVGKNIVIGKEEDSKKNEKEKLAENNKKKSENGKSTPIILYLLIIVLLALNALLFLAFNSREKMLEARIAKLENNMKGIVGDLNLKFFDIEQLINNLSNQPKDPNVKEAENPETPQIPKPEAPSKAKVDESNKKEVVNEEKESNAKVSEEKESKPKVNEEKESNAKVNEDKTNKEKDSKANISTSSDAKK